MISVQSERIHHKKWIFEHLWDKKGWDITVFPLSSLQYVESLSQLRTSPPHTPTSMSTYMCGTGVTWIHIEFSLTFQTVPVIWSVEIIWRGSLVLVSIWRRDGGVPGWLTSHVHGPPWRPHVRIHPGEDGGAQDLVLGYSLCLAVNSWAFWWFSVIFVFF